MNLQEVIDNIRDLGFSDDAEMEEFGELIYNSINRAISRINVEVSPIIGEFEIEQDGTDDEYNYYDMRSLTRRNGKDTFLSFASVPVMIENASGVGYKRFNDFEVEQGSILVFAPEVAGTFKVMYKKAHDTLTAESDPEKELELPLRVHHLVPLLASYYVWLEDEPTKAAQYYNMYEQQSAVILSDPNDFSNKIRMRVLPGGM